MYNKIPTYGFFAMAEAYANFNSGCCKVRVGSVITDASDKQKVVAFGANRVYPDLCRTRGCMRVEKYGENSNTHRLPSDCRALHSEIDAIANSKQDLTGCTIYVTRYPCEACARAICASGISKVVFYGVQDISQETRAIFDDSHVEVLWSERLPVGSAENEEWI